jgi:predicted RecB family endonuclease
MSGTKQMNMLQRASSPPRSVDINVYARLNVYEVVVWIGRRVVMLPLQINFNI